MKYPIKSVGIKHLDWVSLALETELPAYAKMLVMYLSRFMNKDKDIAYPSLSRIEIELSITRSTACKYLTVLEDEGWITRKRGGINPKNNKNTTTTYTISYPKLIEGVVQEMNHLIGGVVRHTDYGSSPHGLGVVRHTDTNQQYQSTIESTIKDICVEPEGPTPANGVDFERFWSAWPVKRNKVKAKQAFSKKKFSKDDVDTLIADVIERQKLDKQWKQGFIPHCSTYLNGERWEDEHGN